MEEMLDQGTVVFMLNHPALFLLPPFSFLQNKKAVLRVVELIKSGSLWIFSFVP